MLKQKKRTRITQSGKNCAIQGARLIWKQKIWLVLTRSYCLLANHISTGITLFALLHLNYTALSPSESSNFLMYIIITHENVRSNWEGTE